MRVTSFGSGSSGNAILVQSEATSVLIDAGIPIRRLRSGLKAAGVDDGALHAIFVSHEHWDHVRTLSQIARYHACPVVATEGTISAAPTDTAAACHWERAVAETELVIGDLRVTPLAVSHDAADPVGFVVDDGATRAAIFTDLGEVSDTLAEPISTAHLVVLEANYDDVMLERGRYPAHLKRRIRGPRGHLSNDACARFLHRTLSAATQDVWLAHLSENNNRSAVARAAVVGALGLGQGLPRVQALPRHGRDVVWDSREATRQPRQISLPLG